MKKLACVANLDVTQVVSPTSVFYTLAFTHLLDNLSRFGSGVKNRTTGKDGPRSNMDWGKACPSVCERRSAVKPKHSLKGK